MSQERAENFGKAKNAGTRIAARAPEPRLALGNRVFTAEKVLLTRMMESLGNPPLALVLWDGQEIAGTGSQPIARVLIRDHGALLKLIANPELEFGEMYTAGRIEVQGILADCLEAIYRAMMRRARYGQITQKLLAPFNAPLRNTVPRARRNIHHHYDIGNDFYKLWLDRDMVYTCAYFSSPSAGLEEAQAAKLDYVCRKLRLTPGETVLETGCGWGALALHMAKHYGVMVKAYNISKEQIVFARERARTEGLDGQVQFIEDDYRNVAGKFDAFVSVGMLEHVGVDQYQALGAVIDRSLKDTGRGLVHSIGRDRPSPMTPWIERNIFPGARPPSLSQMMQIFEPFGFSVLDVENLRLHYAKTLEHWLLRYEANVERVEKMFDAAFVRTWRLYLAGSLAAFRSGDMQLFQVSFNRAGQNRIPWTRQYLYTS
ncbi:MAG: class I SAM-dependent methyltransferase [Burkholderiales bacterium]|nr:class I SAM-dependent methyltransferase [Burkholderiales bacterium]